MAEPIYLLCAVTSVACALLLARSWRRTRQRLLVWSTACFVALAVNNCLLVIDLALEPQGTLMLWRNATALAGVGALLAGLIWEAS